jgi:cob(I)alamin adenosyltransferase
MSERKGLVHVYTGEGRGKSTSSFGLALRASGQGLKVIIIQFMKESPPQSGEVKVVKEYLPNIEIHQFGGSFIQKDDQSYQEVKRRIEEGFATVEAIVEQNACDLLILDEINVAIKFGFLSLKEVIELVKRKPKEMELVLSGRYADPKLIEIADYVTEFRLVKHPFEKGISSRKGIEY